ncbi:glycosyl hydrolases family 31-domain-containing protein [Tuber brumale]|nr:glycosyl hydrolases family 31-domain-containing protein [Tuber brumale]
MLSLTLSAAILVSISLISVTTATRPRAPDANSCPGYKATNIKETDSGLTAELQLAGTACNIYGKDLANLKLQVTYDSKSRIQVKIADPEEKRYQVPEEVFPRPDSRANGSAKLSDIAFTYAASPFGFTITRRSSGEKLFDTTGNALVFESQYLRLKTSLPTDPNIYGLGEHTDSFRLPNINHTRTLWSRDSYGIPQNSNLYGNHPIYFDHRKSGTHGVFLLNSNGMDIKLETVDGKSSLEYNVIGGVFDLYFFAGPEPVAVAKQYAEVVGLPAMMPYWGLGFHQCRYGYRDWIEVAEAIANYSIAEIPLETMWTDIDYMYNRWIFTLDPERFPLNRVREIVDYLHEHDQHYIVMVDPATAYQDYPTFNRGKEDDIWLKEADGSIHKGVVWPGVAAFPDWFHPNTGSFWTGEFVEFFSADAGVNIDGVWIDMNEPASFCSYPCIYPEADAAEQKLPPQRPPARKPPRSIPGFPGTASATATAQSAKRRVHKRQKGGSVDLISPPYAIANDAPLGLGDRTVHTDVAHYGGLSEYDTHNLYGTMMSDVTYEAMLARRPGLRPLVITRSTFAGAGKHVGNRWSIAGMLGFASIYQIPMVGSDVCGFGGNTTETLCARWASLGAFNPFFRNHNGDTSIPQEFYLWPLVASSARKSIEIRYRLLDYIYTAMHHQSVDGTPLLNPLFFKYPKDTNTYKIDTQFIYGNALLVSPVIGENSTSVEVYLPKDTLYDFHTGKKIKGEGKNVTLTNIPFDEIPLHIIGGNILPFRSSSAHTTAELRTRPFTIVIAADERGEASGGLYIDDGVSIQQKAIIDVTMEYKSGRLSIKGKFGFKGETDGANVRVESVKVLGKKRENWERDGEGAEEVFEKKVCVELVGDVELEV